LKGEQLTGLEPSEALDFFESKVKIAFPDAKPDRDRMSFEFTMKGLFWKSCPQCEGRDNCAYLRNLERLGQRSIATVCPQVK